MASLSLSFYLFLSVYLSSPHPQAVLHAQHSAPALCGHASQSLSKWMLRMASMHASGVNERDNWLGKAPPAIRVDVMLRLSSFLAGPGPALTLWQLAASVVATLGTCGVNDGSAVSTDADSRTAAAGAITAAVWPLPLAQSHGYQHASAMRAALTSAANQLEVAAAQGRVGDTSWNAVAFCGNRDILGSSKHSRTSNCGAKGSNSDCCATNSIDRSPTVCAVRGRGPRSNDASLIDAALLHLRAGDFERCAELLAQADEWEAALALAPAASLEVWRRLLDRRVEAATKAGTCAVELVPLMLAAGRSGALVDALQQEGELELAADIAGVAAAGCGCRSQCMPATAQPAAVAGMRVLSHNPPTSCTVLMLRLSSPHAK
jgi:hypothetical protein